MSLGPTEILVVLLVALIVLGPDKLPQAARTLSKYLAEFRKFSASVHSQVDEVLRMPDDSQKKPEDQQSQHEAEERPKNPDISGFELIDQQQPEKPKE